MGIARYYDPDANPDGAFFVGVPLDDVSDEVWDRLPAWQQASVDASPFYRKTKPRPAKADKPDETPAAPEGSADDAGSTAGSSAAPSVAPPDKE